MTIWTPELKDFNGPKYKALADAIAFDIQRGVLCPEQQLPTHRYLAEELGVTVGTVTRGYAEAERRNLVIARVGSGTFVKSQQRALDNFLIPAQGTHKTIDMGIGTYLAVDQKQELATTLKKISEDPMLLLKLMTYHSEPGLHSHRSAICKWLTPSGIQANPDQIILCNGGQNAIFTALQAVAQPGDWVFSEGLTYPGYNNIIKQLHLRQLGIPMDDQGILPKQFDKLAKLYKPRALYCMPTLHNPTSLTMPTERRLEILEVAKKHDIIIIEDEVQAVFAEDRPPAMAELSPDQVILIGSNSKALNMGFRLGYLLSPSHLAPKIETVVRTQCLMVPPLMAEIFSQWVNSGKARKILDERRKKIIIRQQMVNEIFKDLEFRSNPACINVWLILPEPWRANEFVHQVEQNGVLIKSSEVFAAGRFIVPHGVRICIWGPVHDEEVKAGLQIIKKTLKEDPKNRFPSF